MATEEFQSAMAVAGLLDTTAPLPAAPTANDTEDWEDPTRSPGDLDHREDRWERRSRRAAEKDFGSSRDGGRRRSASPSDGRRRSPLASRRAANDQAMSKQLQPVQSSLSVADKERRHSADGSDIRVGRRVFVGNLAYEVRWSHLKDFARAAGEVLHADVLLNDSGRSKGCGVVEYSSEEDARRAIEMLNNKDLMGRPVFIREDRESHRPLRRTQASTAYPPQPLRYDSQSYRSSSGGDSRYSRQPASSVPYRQSSSGRPVGFSEIREPSRHLFVGNIPYSSRWQDIKDLFSRAGRVARADVLETPDGRSRGCAVVAFDSAPEAAMAIQMFNGFALDGRPIEVREDRFASDSSNQSRSVRSSYDDGRSHRDYRR